MRIAVIGATGNIGARTVRALTRNGHEPVRISRSTGVDVTTGDGLDAAFAGVAAVIDVSSTEALERSAAVGFFTAATDNVLAAEQRAGVGHHVALSIVGLDRVEGNAHYAGKLAQERLVSAGPVPWSIVRATQFHDFAETVVAWSARDGAATVAPLLVQPIAPDDVADVLVEIAAGAPVGRYRDVAGPATQDLVDMARRTLAVRGQDLRLVPSWAGVFGPEMAGNVLLPGPDARLAPTSFEEWLR